MNKEERLQKLIANYGNFSRRQADALIANGKVKINGRVATLGDKGSVDDKIEIEGKSIKFNLKHEYYLLNKPKGFICAREDERGKEAISLIDNPTGRNLFTIGRLDVQTTGLIIVTTDGELANEVNSPRSKVRKTYLAFVNKSIRKEDLLKLQMGVVLDDGYKTQKVANWKTIANDKEKAIFKITLTEGKKNQIRRMFAAIDREVVNLKRISIGYHKIDGIELGQYKRLSKTQMYEGLGKRHEH